MKKFKFIPLTSILILLLISSDCIAQTSVDAVKDLTFQPSGEARTYPLRRRYYRDELRYDPPRQFNPWADEDEIERRKAKKAKAKVKAIPTETSTATATQNSSFIVEDLTVENSKDEEQDKKCFKTDYATNYFNNICAAQISDLMDRSEQSAFESEAATFKTQLVDCSAKAISKLTSEAMAAGTFIFKNTKFDNLARFTSVTKLECEKQSILFFAEENVL